MKNGTVNNIFENSELFVYEISLNKYGLFFISFSDVGRLCFDNHNKYLNAYKMFHEENRIFSEKEQENGYDSFIKMENLLEKLKILNYEEEFLKEIKMKPIHKYYFVVSKNPGEQFYLFTLLSAYLIKKSGKPFEKPQEFDDPNIIISNILDVLRQNGINIDFAPNKLKQGVGPHVVYVLDHLANEALKKHPFSWQPLEIPEETQQESEILEDDSEINLDRVEEEMLAAYSDESDEENVFHVRDFAIEARKDRPFEMTSNIDQEMWRLELERVLPQLKVTVRSDGRDWRARLEQMRMYRKGIEEAFGSTKLHLERVHKEVASAAEKATTREKFLNRELEPVLKEYRLLQDQLNKVREKYKEVSGGVAERNAELAKLTERLETVKQQMEERGNSMTDGSMFLIFCCRFGNVVFVLQLR